jgi:hypothetical protein
MTDEVRASGDDSRRAAEKRSLRLPLRRRTGERPNLRPRFATKRFDSPNTLVTFSGVIANAGAVFGYVALAVACYFDLWARGLTHTYLYHNDGIAMMWFLNWLPYALGHGLNPFHAGLLNVPHGVNVLQQTSVQAVAFLLAPVSIVFGPVAAFNFGLALGLAGSATSMYFVSRRFIRWRGAAFVAGLLYGFGPYEIGQGIDHLNLCFCVLPPVILLMVHDIAIGKGNMRRKGIWLGVLAAVQFFISIEILATTALMSVVLLLAMAVRGRRHLREGLRAALPGLAWAIGVGGALLAYPAWYAVAGPDHVNGPVQVTALYRADLLGSIVPDGLMRLAPSSLVGMANTFAGNWNENGSYLGITLLVVLIIGALWLRKRGDVRVLLAVGLTAFIFSLGSRLVVKSTPAALRNGAATGSVPLPWALLERLPLLGNVLPARFTLYEDLAGAMLLGIIIDRLHAATATRRPAPVAALAPLGVAVFALFPLVPAIPYPFARPVPASTYFSSHLAEELPVGRTAVIYPYPSAGSPQAMLWQTEAGMRFGMPGGYALVPVGPGGTLATMPGAINAYPTQIGRVLSSLAEGEPPPRNAKVRQQVLGELRDWRAGSLVAVPTPGTARTVVAYLSWLLGKPPVHQKDADVWYRLDSTPRRQ